MKSNASVLRSASAGTTSWPESPAATAVPFPTTASPPPASDPNLPVYPWALVACSSILFCTFVVGSAANALALFVTVRQHLHNRRAAAVSANAPTATTIPILSLSAADSLVMLALPPWGLYVGRGYEWPPGAAALCRLSGLSLLVGVFASALTLSWISVERCAAVLAPARARLLRSPRVSAAGLCASWLPSAALGVLLVAEVSAFRRADGSHGNVSAGDIAAGHNGSMACGYASEDRFTMWSLGNRPGRGIPMNVASFLLPFAVLGASYAAVCRRVCSLSRFEGSRVPADRVLRLLFLLTVVFCVAWCPYTVANLYYSGGGAAGRDAERLENTIGELCVAVGILNSALNPLLYCLWTRRDWQSLVWRPCGGRRPARVGASSA